MFNISIKGVSMVSNETEKKRLEGKRKGINLEDMTPEN